MPPKSTQPIDTFHNATSTPPTQHTTEFSHKQWHQIQIKWIISFCGAKPFVVSQEAICSIPSSYATSTNIPNANWNASQIHATWPFVVSQSLFVKSPVHMPHQQTPKMQIEMHPNYMQHDERRTEDLQPKHALHTTKIKVLFNGAGTCCPIQGNRFNRLLRCHRPMAPPDGAARWRRPMA